MLQDTHTHAPMRTHTHAHMHAHAPAQPQKPGRAKVNAHGIAVSHRRLTKPVTRKYFTQLLYELIREGASVASSAPRRLNTR